MTPWRWVVERVSRLRVGGRKGIGKVFPERVRVGGKDPF